jgi:hypothetical protein
MFPYLSEDEMKEIMLWKYWLLELMVM